MYLSIEVAWIRLSEEIDIKRAHIVDVAFIFPREEIDSGMMFPLEVDNTCLPDVSLLTT
jgi:hypothetical protein